MKLPEHAQIWILKLPPASWPLCTIIPMTKLEINKNTTTLDLCVSLTPLRNLGSVTQQFHYIYSKQFWQLLQKECLDKSHWSQKFCQHLYTSTLIDQEIIVRPSYSFESGLDQSKSVRNGNVSARNHLKILQTESHFAWFFRLLQTTCAVGNPSRKGGKTIDSYCYIKV